MTEGADRWASRQCTFTTASQGVRVLPGFADPSAMAKTVEAELEAAGEKLVRHRSESPRLAILDEGGERSYTVLGRTALEAVLPEVAELYRSAQAASRAELSLPLQLSTHDESSATAKIYGPGDSQGWHLDTNPVTALLLLRVTDGVSPILWEDLEGRMRGVKCAAGDLVAFEGKRVRHCVPLHGDDDATVMLLFNLYLPDDSERPPEMDQFALLGDDQPG
jgi:hypothetical protein